MFAQQSAQSPRSTDPWSMWSDLMFKLMNAGCSFSPDATPPEAFRQVRSAMLDTWADFWQRWLRTPEFLQLLKQTMDMNFQMRRQVGDFWSQLRHESQGTSREDFDQLMRALRHLEHRMADSTERISSRLEDIEDRLGAAEGRPEREDPDEERSRRHRRSNGRRPRRRSL
jgi:hypothetical protein